MDASYSLAKYFNEIKFEDLPQNVVSEVKKQILDYIGVAVAGACKPGANEIRELYEELGGVEQASVWCSGKKLPVTSAAQVNATLGHCLDFDDVHEKAIMHPGVVSVPVALTMGEYLGGVSGKELLTCVALAGDMICRIGLAAWPGHSIIPSGWHMTTLNGSIVAANLAARMMGLTQEQAVNAMGIAYHQSAGNGQPVKDGALTKRLGPGFSVRNGITSALLAEKGVTGAHNCFNGEWGFARQFFQNDWDNEALIGDLGKRWESEQVGIKPYPCCRGTHHFCDIGVELHNQVDPDQIEKIRLWTTEATMGLLGAPLEVKAFPSTTVESQFSIAWGVASGIAMGQVSLSEFTESDAGIHNPKILAISKKIVSIEVDPSLSGSFDGARVEVTMKDGTVYNIIREKPKGGPDNPLTFDEVTAKFRGCMGSADRKIPAENADKIIELVKNLETLEDSRELTALLTWEA